MMLFRLLAIDDYTTPPTGAQRDTGRVPLCLVLVDWS